MGSMTETPLTDQQPEDDGPEPNQATSPVAEDSAGPSGGAGVPAEPETEALKRVEAELEELKDRHARLAAEFDNYRKRVSRENQLLAERAQAALAIKVLDVLDDLDRIIEGVDESTPADSLNEALVLVDRKLRKELEAAGLERIDPQGNPFDPVEHEAIAATPAPSPDQEQQVSATFQAGYRFKGSLIRPARVQVFTDPGQA